ncbi:hypothetical protein MSAR_00150 [Mycolicibacterium sarraceniae]|uniref:Uncharacterized protein n=1 Tax=Mycolicibacterium sarraceniae TaxID=1534348 RepID=A0A7I7SKS8_9MYCO|nr:hypothetical protein MSAR_00150 [Mycolicibacterium sarraceniae]
MDLRLGADRHVLTVPVVRSATKAVLLSGPMISPLVLSRHPCITPGAGQALGNGLGGSGGGGGGELGPGPRSGAVVKGCEMSLLNLAQPADVAATTVVATNTASTPRTDRRTCMPARLRISR